MAGNRNSGMCSPLCSDVCAFYLPPRSYSFFSYNSKFGTASPPARLVSCNVVSLILGHLSFQINLEIMELISLK